jgi:hypothetical protein
VEDREDIPPEPANTGSEEGQTAPAAEQTTALVSRRSLGAYTDYSLADAVEQVGERGVRGESGRTFLVVNVRTLEGDLRAARAEIVALRDAKDVLRDELAAARTTLAVNGHEIAGLRQQRWVRTILTTVGGTILGVAASDLNRPDSEYAVAGTIIGAVVLLIGLFLPLQQREASP